jgi:hypothetical protein
MKWRLNTYGHVYYIMLFNKHKILPVPVIHFIRDGNEHDAYKMYELNKMYNEKEEAQFIVKDNRNHMNILDVKFPVVYDQLPGLVSVIHGMPHRYNCGNGFTVWTSILPENVAFILKAIAILSD